MKREKKIFPPIGQRMIKSAIAVFITYLIYELRGRKGIPFYTAIAAIQCIQPYWMNTRKMCINRIFGTLNGAFWGLITLLIEMYVLQNQYPFVMMGVVSLSILAVMYTAVLLEKRTVVYFSCVVYLSIVMIHMGDEKPLLFVANRVLDTLIGILIAVIISNFALPKKRDKETLFVCGMDESLLRSDLKISDYSRVELNRMIDSGMRFTIATERTSASLIESIGDIRVNLPVITFNGAVLFDMKKKEYLKIQEIDRELVDHICSFLNDSGVCCYSTALLQDTLMIYYDKFYSEVEEKIYQNLRSSLHRNYMQGTIHEGARVFYLMAVGEDEIISNIYHRLREKSWFSQIRVVRMKSSDYPGNTYLKIYHKNATKQNMIHELMNQIGAEKVVTLGSIPHQYDILIQESDHDEMVKALKKKYETKKITKV